MKKILAAALVLVMLLSLGVSASAATISAAGNLNDQASLLFNNFNALKQNDSPTVWYYTVTDLDHNGRLELLALTTASDLSNEATLKAWEVSQDGQHIEQIKHEFSDASDPALKDGFMNIMTDSADTYFDSDTNTWFYVFTDYSETHTDLTPEESAQSNGIKHIDMSITATAGLSKHGDHLDRGVLGYKLVTNTDGKTEVSFGDKDGNAITEEQFLSIGVTSFAGKQRSSTSFDWFTAADATQDRFTRSYNVFDNAVAAPQELRPNTTSAASSLAITKNPTNEVHNAGESALFISGALNYDRAVWSFLDLNGNTVSASDFALRTGATVSGENSTNLTVYNLNNAMNGWGVFCTFYGSNNQSARTTTAYIYTRYTQTQIKEKNLGNFYTTYTYVYGTWICPFCGNEVWGDYCPYCGFDPDYYYEYYITDPVVTTPIYVEPDVIYYPPVVDYVDWYCPACGVGNTGTSYCWNCGYGLNDVVIDYYYPEYDYWNDSYDFVVDDYTWAADYLY